MKKTSKSTVALTELQEPLPNALREKIPARQKRTTPGLTLEEFKHALLAKIGENKRKAAPSA